MNEYQLVDHFCKSLDARFLLELPDVAKREAVSMAKKTLKDKGNLQVAKKILNVLDSKSLPTRNRENVTEKKAQAILNEFAVSLTGAQPEDYIVGELKRNKGTIMKIHGSVVYPQQNKLDKLRKFEVVWQTFLMKLGAISFYSSMSINEREKYLAINEDPTDAVIGESNERIEFLHPGAAEFLEELDEEDISQMFGKNTKSEDGYFNSEEIFEFFPGVSGSEARHKVLILNKSVWRLTITHKFVNTFDGVVINIATGEITNGASLLDVNMSDKYDLVSIPDITKKVEKEDKKKETKWFRPSGDEYVQEIGLLLPKSKKRLSSQTYKQIINNLLSEDIKDINTVEESIKHYTPGALKSLLQKILRFRPTTVVLLNKMKISAQLMLLVSFMVLAQNPGSFVPDIQRFVSGLESATKRLVVTFAEDTLFPSEKPIISLLGGALAAQRVKSWVPTSQVIEWWMKTAIKGWETKKAYIYDFNTELQEKPYTLSVKNNTIENISALLDELKSFHTDLAMVRYIARHWSDIKYTTSIVPDILEMPIYHCVDQHWIPNLSYLFKYDLVKKIPFEHHAFKGLFNKLFKESSGLNFRRITYNKNMLTSEFMVEAKKVQKIVTIAQFYQRKERPILTNNYIDFSYKLEDAWLAGMIGVVDVKIGKQRLFVTLDSNNIQNMIVILRPTRDMKNSEVDAEKSEEAKQIVEDMLSKKGLALNKTEYPSEYFHGAKLLRRNKQYMIEKNGKLKSWDEAKKISIFLPVHRTINKDYENAFLFSGKGIEEDAMTKLDTFIKTIDNRFVRRLMNYIDNFRPKFEINKISRDGYGTKHAVSTDDIVVFQSLLMISMLFPGVIYPSKTIIGEFIIISRPVFWILKDKIRKYLSNKLNQTDTKKWSTCDIKDTNNRKLKPYQRDAVTYMINAHNNNMKGHFIWLKVGSGKTLIILTFLKYLISQNQLPKYILYSAPIEAIKTIAKQIHQFNFEMTFITPNKSINSSRIPKYANLKKSCSPVANTINIIEHDALRKCFSELMTVAGDTFFIMDEAHKALGDSQRTTAALGLSHSSRSFVALTGTPTTDTKIYKLLWWLEQVNVFEVNEKNFWVAANSMIHQNIDIGIDVHYNEITIDFSPIIFKEYQRLVSAVLGGTKVSPTMRDISRATELCYEICDKAMVRGTIDYIKNKERGVMLVAQNNEHVKVLYKLLKESKKIKNEDIFLLTEKIDKDMNVSHGASIDLTDIQVETGEIHDYKVVIVPLRKSAGYELTRLSVQIKSVYPSNSATREQSEGRINRIGQKRDDINIDIYHIGILSRLLHNHNDAKSLNMALESIHKNN